MLSPVILSLFKQPHYMIRFFSLILLAPVAFISCASHPAHLSGPYEPATEPEKTEYGTDRLDVYPDQVRKDLNAYTNTPVAWVGVIRSTDARDMDAGDQISAVTVFEDHYFDWVQYAKHGEPEFSVSPRGEGLFRTKWTMKKTNVDSTYRNAERYAKKGQLAVVYGVPESVDPDGTVVLKYRYLRIIGADHFVTNQFDYGRAGEPFSVIHH